VVTYQGDNGIERWILSGKSHGRPRLAGEKLTRREKRMPNANWLAFLKRTVRTRRGFLFKAASLARSVNPGSTS